MSVTEKEKKRARAYRFVLGGLVGPGLRAREGERRGGFGGLGQMLAWLGFFEIKHFQIFLPANKSKQNQINSKFDQIKFVEFRKINST